MSWAVLKPIAWQVVGPRTLGVVALSATAGAAVVAAAGAAVVGAALGDDSLPAHARAPALALALAAVVYGACGALAGAQWALVASVRRAMEHARPALRPHVDRVTSAALARLADASGAPDAKRIDELIDATFDAVRRTSDLPVLRHIAGAAASVAHRRVRRAVEPIIESLSNRRRSRPDGTANMESDLSNAICTALLDAAISPLARMRAATWLGIIVLLVIPLIVWAVRAWS